MTERDKTTPKDDDLRALFDELRREEHRDVPPYRRAHWVPERPGPRSVWRWRLAIVASCAVIVTAGLAALGVGWMPLGPIEALPGPAGPALEVATNLPTPTVDSRPPRSSDSEVVTPASEPAATVVPKLPAAGDPETPSLGGRLRIDDFGSAEPLPEAEKVAEAAPRETRLWWKLADELVVESVTVASAEPAGESSSEDRFTDEFVSNLPVQGRFYTNVLTLAPGVQDTDGVGNPNVHGSRERDYKAIVGGVANEDPLTGLTMSNIEMDSVEEIEVVTDGAGLKYGRAQGGYAKLTKKNEAVKQVLGDPPPTGPLLAGADGIEEPERIPGPYVKPVYPELARKARIENTVILQAVIRKDGTSQEITVLQSAREGLGFEEEAIEAVRQWRFKPATRNGEPVEVYYTVQVDFSLDEKGEIVASEPSFGPSIESYAAIEDNPFHVVTDEPLSTFSADVDTASYANVRRFLTNGSAPPRDAVRIEEMINYFDYEHPAPAGNDPFGVAIEVTDSPWNARHRLARITLAARHVEREERPAANLVFLLDVSGSMQPHNKLPLVKSAMTLLVQQLEDRDTIAIVVYAGASGLVLPPTPGSDRATILNSLRRLGAGGGTAGAAGLQLAYKIARENFVPGGINRVILATDGDFNVGVTSHSQLLRIIEKDAKRGVFLTALGFGMGNYKDDRLEQLADRGNGNYAYIDTLAEARKVLVEEVGGTLVTVAKDVKFQVEFNPMEVGAYRLIGYENRLLAHRDFNDDTKDAGEVGAGHTVTVLYELVPPSREGTKAEVDPLRYRRDGKPSEAARSGELFTLKIRFKRPDGDTSALRTYPVQDEGLPLAAASDDTRFAAAMAAFGMRLRQSEPVRDFGWAEIRDLAAGAIGRDAHGHRAQSLELMDGASRVAP